MNNKEKIYECIYEYTKTFKLAPSIREISELTSIKSTATIHKHILELQREGKIIKINKISRGLQIVNKEE